MRIGPIGRQTVVVLEAPLVAGAYGRKARDWGQATRITVPGATVDYTSASESTDAQDQTTTRATAYLPPGTQVSVYARVEWDGRTWQVDGVPDSPEAAGILGGPVVSLLEVAG